MSVYHFMSRDQRCDAVRNMAFKGVAYVEIARHLGCSVGEIYNVIAKIKKAGGNVPPIVANLRRGYSAHTVERMNLIADQMADGCPSISECARRLGLEKSRADKMWQAVKRDLGAQAA